MITSLKFEAPADLSIGKVRVTDAHGTLVKEWWATPDDHGFTGAVEPGYFQATIAPTGVPTQTVIFEVHAGEQNDITMPIFSSLRASSGNTTFLDIADPTRAIDTLFGSDEMHELPPSQIADENDDDLVVHDQLFVPSDRLSTDASSRPSLTDDGFSIGSSQAEAIPLPPEGVTTAPPAAPQRLSVGLSAEQPGKHDSFGPFTGHADIELAESRLELVVSGTEGWSPATGARVRLTVAIQDIRVERLLLPMYRGGVQIAITPSSLSRNDVELEVLPADPSLRALARSLIAGTPDEAAAVRSLVRAPDVDGDPWEAILSALLSIRFPDAGLPSLTAELADGLVAVAPWAYDSYVIQARQRLYTGAGDADRPVAAAAALDLLAKAQVRGSPYFSYANQLFSETVEALHGYFDKTDFVRLRKKAAKVRDRWQREQPLQSRAGASFSWLRRDPAQLKEGILAPDRHPAGLLGASATLLFAGEIVAGSIRLDPLRTKQPPKEQESPQTSPITFGDVPIDCPALKRAPGPADDSNLGRFGGEANVGGYSLKTEFGGDPNGEVVAITMTVTSDGTAAIAPGAVAWFCLHDTFHPQWIKVIFGDDRATLSVQAWGGFTVGVWLPQAGVELESNLSKLSSAPAVVRDR